MTSVLPDHKVFGLHIFKSEVSRFYYEDVWSYFLKILILIPIFWFPPNNRLSELHISQ